VSGSRAGAGKVAIQTTLAVVSGQPKPVGEPGRVAFNLPPSFKARFRQANPPIHSAPAITPVEPSGPLIRRLDVDAQNLQTSRRHV